MFPPVYPVLCQCNLKSYSVLHMHFNELNWHSATADGFNSHYSHTVLSVYNLVGKYKGL